MNLRIAFILFSPIGFDTVMYDNLRGLYKLISDTALDWKSKGRATSLIGKTEATVWAKDWLA